MAEKKKLTRCRNVLHLRAGNNRIVDVLVRMFPQEMCIQIKARGLVWEEVRIILATDNAAVLRYCCVY